MANRVDPMGNRMQAADCKSMIHGVFSQATPQQLPPRNDSMLLLRELRQGGVTIPASTSQPAYIAG